MTHPRQGNGAQDAPATLSPRQLAASAGISTDTLRYYERNGVLAAPERTPAGYRRYPRSAIARVAIVRRALAIGFSIKELSRVFRERDHGGAPCRKVRDIVSDRLSRIDAEIDALTVLKRDLSDLLEQWDARLTAAPPNTQVRLLDSLTAAPNGCTGIRRLP